MSGKSKAQLTYKTWKSPDSYDDYKIIQKETKELSWRERRSIGRYSQNKWSTMGFKSECEEWVQRKETTA